MSQRHDTEFTYRLSKLTFIVPPAPRLAPPGPEFAYASDDDGLVQRITDSAGTHYSTASWPLDHDGDEDFEPRLREPTGFKWTPVMAERLLVTHRIRRTEGKDVPTGRKRATWFCDTCMAETSTGTWKAHDGAEGTWCYACSQRGIKSALRTIAVDETRFERGTVEVMCCKVWLLCDGFTNTCSRCGQDYNFAGQALAPRECWGEETGECAADLLRLDGDLG